MSVYDIETDVVVNQHIPVKNRWAKRFAWLRLLVWPITVLIAQFQAFRASRLYRLAHNSQVCYMEAALNDLFDNDLRRIYISDGAFVDPVSIYLVTEDKPVWLALVSELPVIDYDAPVYLYAYSETSEFGFQFIVHVPDAITLASVIVRIRALVERYRLPGKNVYDIVSYTP